jgi:hypothetical protein
MEFARYIFDYRVLTPMALTARKGSVLRGAIGASLRRVTCALRRERCETCLLKGRCVYSIFFEPLPPVKGRCRPRTCWPGARRGKRLLPEAYCVFGRRVTWG